MFIAVARRVTNRLSCFLALSIHASALSIPPSVLNLIGIKSYVDYYTYGKNIRISSLLVVSNEDMVMS